MFMGIEEGVVSGDQATRAWATRLANRQARYVTPMLIDPVLRRLIDFGVLAPTAEPMGWTVEWPEMVVPTEKEQAEIAELKTKAFAAYVGGNVDALVPPMEFLTLICGLDDDTAQSIIDAAIEHITGTTNDDIMPGRMPAPEPEPVPEPPAGPPGGAPKAKPPAVKG